PETSYDDATRAKVIIAGQDPVALDYWAAKHILLQQAAQNTKIASLLSTMDPDNVSSRSFGKWLRLSMEEINQAGYQTTVDEARMNVYVSRLQLPSSTPAAQPSPTTHRGIWTYLAIFLVVILVALTVGTIVIRRKRRDLGS
ncbi:MAG: hypothetical protein JXB43_08820, partial [Dehalococcoidia bacterium]|nr:hypothetical protein [Dehalococcoidia bacterium]